MVGMSKSGSRYGRRSNWFKIHCLLQDQASLSGQLEAGLHGGSVGVLNGQGSAASGFNGALNAAAAAAAAKLVAYDAAVKESRDHAAKEEMMTSSPESQSQGGDSCSEPDAKSCVGGFDAKLKSSGSLSPLSPYESPSPPYEKKENSTSGGYVHSLPMSPVSPVTSMHHQAHPHSQHKFFFTPTSSAAAAAAAAAAAIGGFIPTGFNGFHHHHHALHQLQGAHQVLNGNTPLAFRPYAAAAALGGLDFLVRKHHKPFLVDVAVGGPLRSPLSAPPSSNHNHNSHNHNHDHQDTPMDLTVRRMSERRNHEDSEDSSDLDDDDEDSYGTRAEGSAGCEAGKEHEDAEEGFLAKSVEPERVQVPLDLTKRT